MIILQEDLFEPSRFMPAWDFVSRDGALSRELRDTELIVNYPRLLDVLFSV